MSTIASPERVSPVAVTDRFVFAEISTEERYEAEVFSASVHTSKHDSTAPDASTPRGELPAEQFEPLAPNAVAREAVPQKFVAVMAVEEAYVIAEEDALSIGKTEATVVEVPIANGKDAYRPPVG